MSQGERPRLLRRIGSFRGRMRLFFFAVVVVPTIAVALVIFALIASSERGQADARLAAAQAVSIRLAEEEQQRALRGAKVIATDAEVAAQIRSGDDAELRRILRRDYLRVGGRRLEFRDINSERPISFGSAKAMMPAAVGIRDEGKPAGNLRLSVVTADELAAKIKRITGQDILIRDGNETLASTRDQFSGVTDPPQSGTVEVAGDRYRAATFQLSAFRGAPLQVTAFEASTRTEEDIKWARTLAFIFLTGFVLLAMVAGSAVTRLLEREIETFLTAARRLGSGDFGAKVPTSGNDEFAQLGHEFNAMSEQLETRLDELRQERIRFARSLRRLGEAFASNLDRKGLLEIVLETAVDTLRADGGAAILVTRAAGWERVAEIGTAGPSADAVLQAQQLVLERSEMITVENPPGFAIGYPLRENPAADDPGEVTGMLVVWRAERSFTANERELFEYLAGQAAVSVENVGLHEEVAREAVTDALTGLANRRRFDQRLEHEAERARSLGLDLAVVILDIDDFKKVNDTYGHQIGDEVLKGVADVLLSVSRDPDTPGRIGGEEMAVVLPGADRTGAHEVAERIRARIEELVFKSDGDSGDSFSVTASIGVASAHGPAANALGLVARGDAALYEAKRTGKNRVVDSV